MAKPMMPNPETVTIVADNAYGFAIINATDFVPESMELYEAPADSGSSGATGPSSPDQAPGAPDVPLANVEDLEAMHDNELIELCAAMDLPSGLPREAMIAALTDALTARR